MNTSDFTSNFWNIYTAVILVASFLGLVWLLVSQNKTKRTGDKVETMGHEWDGIEEFNNPLPRWWFYLFVITVVFGIAYLLLYPGFASFKGMLGWTSANQYDGEVAAAKAEYQPIYSKFANKPIEVIATDAEAKKIGQNLYNTYCIQCHGSDAKGAKGFPNLTDKDWLWGGKPSEIEESIRYGRLGNMPAYGGLDPFPEDSAKDVAHYVLSLNENDTFRKQATEARVAKGKVIYDQICFTCHQEDGKGLQGLAPNLTDNVWLWGPTEKDIVNTIMHGHTNQMPAWESFLVDGDDTAKLRILTAYVWGLSDHTGEAPEILPYQDDAAAAPADDAASVTIGDDGVVKFYFATGSQELAANANDSLAAIVAGAGEGKKVVISGFHDATGDAAQNAELAKNRAKAVQAALVALGVNEGSIELKKPETTEGDGTNAEARRVEVSLQ
ncbi:MAG: cytochrome-c oxidase, cbb3-type subunit III [Neisseriaceae bacterium]|nr:cytochrome-c oxidase, cbb3-type subunit III [Neisseriaceae bacterium]